MRMPVHARSANSKKAVNLSVDAELLRLARASGLNLSALLEKALVDAAAHRWLAENREAIEAYNEEIGKQGAWSDGWRRW